MVNVTKMRHQLGRSIPDTISFIVDPMDKEVEWHMDHQLNLFMKQLAIKYERGVAIRVETSHEYISGMVRVNAKAIKERGDRIGHHGRISLGRY